MNNQATSVDHFMRRISRYPLLEAAEERDLARRWRDQRDEEAIDKLVGSHLRLVAKIARGSLGYGLPLADLIAEGSVGLMQAAEKFDPEMGNRFSTYATWWIRAAIGQYVMHNAHIVRVGTTAAQKKLFFNLRALKARHGDLGSEGVTPEVAEKIATQLGVTIADVLQMDGRIGPGRQVAERAARRRWYHHFRGVPGRRAPGPRGPRPRSRRDGSAPGDDPGRARRAQ